MKASQAVVCPKCGARNRPNWTFCARCNESLEGAETVEGQESDVEEAVEGPAPATVPGSLVVLVTVLALLVGGAAAWRYASRASPPARPDPGMFTIGTQPSPLPIPPSPAGPGAAEFIEGRRLLNVKDFAGAIPLLEAAAAADPENAEYHNVYAHALWRSGDRDRALAEYSVAARQDPRLEMDYARNLDVAGRTEDAAREYAVIVAQNPDAPVVREDYGRLLFRSGQYAKAAEQLRQAVEKRPVDPVLQQELAYSLDKAGDREQATAAYRDVLKVAPGATVTRGLLAENLYERGQKSEAIAVLQEGLKQSPEAPLLQRQMGSVLERSGQSAEAAAAYREYVRLAPNAPDAAQIAARAARLEATGRKP
jgi:Flp pilus assembly protein TadD